MLVRLENITIKMVRLIVKVVELENTMIKQHRLIAKAARKVNTMTKRKARQRLIARIVASESTTIKRNGQQNQSAKVVELQNTTMKLASKHARVVNLEVILIKLLVIQPAFRVRQKHAVRAVFAKQILIQTLAACDV